METELKTAIWKIANAAIEMHEDKINGQDFEEFAIKALKAVKNNAVLPLVSDTVYDPDWEIVQTAPHGIQYKHKKTGETKWE